MRRGFTLIELVAVLALMGILVTTVILNVGALDVARLKTDASRLAAAVRYLHNLAVMNNGYYRLVLDLGTGKYSGEEIKPSGKGCSVFVRTDEDEEREAREAQLAKKGDKKAGGEGGGDPGPGTEGAPPPATGDGGKPAPGGGQAKPGSELRRKANLLKDLELGRGVKFEGVLSQYRKELQTEGKTSILFFPDGSIERALIYVANDEETWTVVTEPAMGIARVYHEKRDDDILRIEHD
jgi:prepilin-type N-terminal cleavage/methylation domain-containing protein